MKAILVLLSLVLVSFIPKDDIKPLLCDKKWTMHFLVISDSTIEIPYKIPVEERPWIRFHANGKFENELKGKKVDGTWSYKEEDKTITTTENYDPPVTAVMNIIKLTTDSLLLRIDEETIIGLKYNKP